MFVFFSNRLGCAGSLLVSAALTLLLVVVLRACSGAPERHPRSASAPGTMTAYEPQYAANAETTTGESGAPCGRKYVSFVTPGASSTMI